MFLPVYRKILTAAFLFFFALLIAIPSSSSSDGLDIDKLIADIKSDDWDKRLPAYGGTEGIKNDKLTNALISMIENRMLNWRFSIRAIQLLGESQKPKALGFLESIVYDPFLNQDCPAIKWNAVVAVGNFAKDPKAADILIAALKSEDNLVVREAIVKSIGKVGSSNAVPLLVSLLNDRSFAIRFSAVKSLEEIGDSQAFRHLKNVAENDNDSLIRNQALLAMKKLSKE